MRNLIFINSHPIQYFVPLYQQIEKSKLFKQTVFYADKGHVFKSFDKEFGIKVKWDIPLLEGYSFKFFDFPILGHLSLIWNILINPHSILVIHGWNSLHLFLAAVFGVMRGHLVCLRAETPLSHELHVVSFKKTIRNLYLRIFFKCIDRFLYIGKQNQDFYLAHQVPESLLVYTPYAVNNQQFSQAHSTLSKSTLRSRYDLSADKRIFLFVGKFIEKKRPLDLLNAFLMAETQNSILVFVGEGVLRPQIEKSIAAGNAKSVVKLFGFKNQSEMPEMYSLADVFVMCSGQGETWGLAINEAMNFSMPILASDLTGSSSDLVIPNKNGFVYTTGNVSDLARLISFYDTCSVDIIKEHGSFSKQLVQSFSYDQIIAALVSLKPNIA